MPTKLPKSSHEIGKIKNNKKLKKNSQWYDCCCWILWKCVIAMRPWNEFFFFITERCDVWKMHIQNDLRSFCTRISLRRKWTKISREIFYFVSFKWPNRTKWKMECSLSHHAICLQCHSFVSSSFRNENQKWKMVFIFVTNTNYLFRLISYNYLILICIFITFILRLFFNEWTNIERYLLRICVCKISKCFCTNFLYSKIRTKQIRFYFPHTTTPVTIKPIITAMINRKATFRRYLAWYSAAFCNWDCPLSTSIADCSIPSAIVSVTFQRRISSIIYLFTQILRLRTRIKKNFNLPLTNSLALLMHNLIKFIHYLINIKYILFDLSDSNFALFQNCLLIF